MKKILFALPTLGGGGAERVLVTLLNNLDKSKYDITLFCIFDGGTNKQYLNNNIKYKSFFKKPFRGNIHLFKFLSPENLYRKMIVDKYDIAISYLEGPTTRIVGGCPYSETKLINWIHTGTHDKKEFLSSYRNVNEFHNVYNKFNLTIFVSNTAREAFNHTFNTLKIPVQVKYNSVDDGLIRELSNERIEDVQFNTKTTNLISVGRYTKQKGYIRLIEIINRLVKEGQDVHLYLLGKGELESQYINLINKYNLKNKITLLGYKENPYKYVKAADLFVCSSYTEGFSTAVTESLIVGTPVITTLCSGMEELLGQNNEHGLITDNDEIALYEGLRKLLINKELIIHYKEKANNRGEFFKLTETVKEVEKLLDSI